MNYFKYDEKALNHLKQDKVLTKAINRIGPIQREVHTDLYLSLITQIIAQLVSKKAAITVTNRLLSLVDNFNPENIVALDIDDIQKCGMTFRKATNINLVSQKILNKEVDLEGLQALSDKEIIKELCKLNGIGEWTAQMYMIFTLQRNDIIAYKDLAIRQGMMKLYQLDSLTKQEFDEYAKIYSPYSSVASLYLWHIAHEKEEE